MATIYKRKKTWYINYTIDGKRVRKRIGPSKKVAELELKNIEVKLSKGDVEPVIKKKRVDDYFEEIRKFVKVNKKFKTQQRYLEVLSHFEDFLSTFPYITYLAQIHSKLIEDYKQHRINFVKPKTANFELGTLNYFFNIAIKHNYLKKNPVANVERLHCPPLP